MSRRRGYNMQEACSISDKLRAEIDDAPANDSVEDIGTNACVCGPSRSFCCNTSIVCPEPPKSFQ